jgi:hypothetical protein
MVLYFMIGCPHCANNQPAWEEAKEKAEKMGLETKEIESASPENKATGFPTMTVEDEDGNIKKKIEGARKSGGQILSELGLKKGGKRKTRKLIRRSRHRTLRNHVSFV